MRSTCCPLERPSRGRSAHDFGEHEACSGGIALGRRRWCRRERLGGRGSRGGARKGDLETGGYELGEVAVWAELGVACLVYASAVFCVGVEAVAAAAHAQEIE